MPPLFDLTVVAPDRQIYQGRAQSLVAPGADGSFGVLANHAPLVAELTVGELKVVDEQGKERFFAIAGGFLEVTFGGVSILADAAEAAADIDVGRAEAAERRARERLSSADLDLDHDRAVTSLSRAMNRMRVASRAH